VSRVRAALEKASPAAFSTYAVAAAFSAYFCMYAFRKPFAVAKFEGETLGPLDLKIALVIAQVCGYALSKFLSIKYVSEITPARRATALLGLIAAAEAALLVYGLVPDNAKIFAIFFNGVPLGGVWGLVFGFLEGRRTSEILGAGLSTSYIVASGAVKTIGGWILQAGVSEGWMPFVTGLLFAGPFAVAVWLLRQLPPPSPEDEAARTIRRPMNGAQRIAFVSRFGVGIVALTGLYMFLTAYRDVRDNFAPELWAALGWGEEPSIFTATEIPVALVVLASLALIYREQNNRRALLIVHWLMLGGTVLIGASTLAFDAELIGPVVWMIALGTGLYLGYVPYGCVLFDRLIAATGAAGTAVFMIYVTDAFGYAGSVGLMLYKNFGNTAVDWLSFFRGFSYVTALVCTAAFAASAWYFARKTRPAS
jgi:hypothetical protein